MIETGRFSVADRTRRLSGTTLRVALWTLFVALPTADPSFAEPPPGCENHRLILTTTFPLELSSHGTIYTGRELAYDFLLRTDARPFWNGAETDALVARLDDVWSRVSSSFDLAVQWPPHLSSASRFVEIEISEDFLAEIVAALPGPRRARAMPDSRFDRFEEVVRELCIRWMLVDSPPGIPRRIQLGLELFANPLHAGRILRSVPEIRAAHIANESALSREGRVRTNIVGAEVYLAIEPPTEPAKYSGQQFFVVGRDRVRRVEKAQSEQMPGFRFPELADGAPPAPVASTVGRSENGLAFTIRPATPWCPQCAAWQSKSEPCPSCRQCHIPTVEEASAAIPDIPKTARLIRHSIATWSEPPPGLAKIGQVRLEFTPRVTGEHTGMANTFDCSCFHDRLECRPVWEPVVFETDPDDYVVSNGGADAAEVLRVARLYREGRFEDPKTMEQIGGRRLRSIMDGYPSGSSWRLHLPQDGCVSSYDFPIVTVSGSGDEAKLALKSFQRSRTSRPCGTTSLPEARSMRHR